MTFPLMFLAVVTCGAGFIPFGHFISSNGESYSIHLDPSVAITSVVIAIISIAIATWMYKNAKQPVADSLAKRFKGLHKAAYNRFYIDDIYQFITHKIIFRCISTPIAWFDRHVVDGFFDFLAWYQHNKRRDSWFAERSGTTICVCVPLRCIGTYPTADSLNSK